MTARLPPIGFWSRARPDDDLWGGKLSKVRAALISEVQLQHGRDRVDLLPAEGGFAHGASWERGIFDSLANSSFFVPIITPNFIQSEWCCREVDLFLQRERQLSEDYPGLAGHGLIFPIQLSDIAGVEAADPDILAKLQERQWFDFRPLRRLGLEDARVRDALAELAADISNRLRLPVRRAVDKERWRDVSATETMSREWVEETLRSARKAEREAPRAHLERERSRTPEMAKAPARSSGRLGLLRTLARLFGVGRVQSDVVPDAAPGTGGTVDFVVVAPPMLSPGHRFAIELWLSPPADRATMVAEATRGGLSERGSRSNVALDPGAVITAALSLPGFEIACHIQSLGWNGDIANIGFIVGAPSSLPPGAHAGTISVMKGSLPFAAVSFTLRVAALAGGNEAPAPLPGTMTRYIRRAFASYATEDRSEVLRRVQGMAAIGVYVFLDVMKIRAGADWEQRLFGEIDRSDRLILFWSSKAAKSAYVDKEWRYALDRHGLDFIDPLPLEDPRFAAPPAELAGKHFNDIYLAFIAAEDALKSRLG